MDNSKNQQPNFNGSQEETTQKATYCAPKILSREILEAVAAACPPPGKGQGQGVCATPSS